MTGAAGIKANERRGTIEAPFGKNKSTPENPEVVQPVWGY
jgi:hypothetical protein